MSQPIDQLHSVLKSHDQSLTTSRQKIFAVLQNQEPLTMHEIIAACHGQTDRASVYRTIMLFERLGIIHRLHIGWKYKIELTDAFSHHHHHLSCTTCGCVIPLVESIVLEQQLHALADQHGFQAESHQLEIRGLCASCQSRVPISY